MRAGETHIGRLRMAGRHPDPLAARLRLEALLTSVDLRPPSLSPSAIVCVRALYDPLPGTLSLKRAVTPSWTRAIRQRLDDLVGRAVRPAREPVPPSAEAVIFADRAELLACLTRGWLEGEASWWWQSLLPLVGKVDFPWRAWQGMPELIPAALTALVATGHATRFVRSLPSPVILSLLVGIARAFNLPELHAALPELLSDSPPPVEAERRSTARDAAPHASAEHTATTLPQVPWHLPTDQRTGLLPIEELLIGVSVTIYRTPHTLRQPATLTQLWRWYTHSVHEAQPELQAVPHTEWKAQHKPQLVSGSPVRSQDASLPLPAVVEMPISSAAVQVTETAISSTGDTSFEQTVTTADVPPALLPGVAVPPPTIEIEAARDEFSSPAVALVDVPMPDFFILPELHRATATAYGGVFYLLNVALALGLYGDFTMPLAPGIPLSPWDWLALLSARWLGESFTADPLAGLLATLAGHDFDPSSCLNRSRLGRAWRLPLSWLDAFPERTGWHWNSTRGRLIILHPAGFPVVDVPRRGTTAAQLAREQRHFPAVEPMTCTVEIQPAASPDATLTSDEIARWIGWLGAYLDARLARALGTADIAGALLSAPARVYSSDTRVDIVFPLSAVSLEARLAGLDRDPGWIPACGRSIAFHYRTEDEG
jgi:hypothetical protein